MAEHQPTSLQDPIVFGSEDRNNPRRRSLPQFSLPHRHSRVDSDRAGLRGQKNKIPGRIEVIQMVQAATNSQNE